jgi:Alginate lyase
MRPARRRAATAVGLAALVALTLGASAPQAAPPARGIWISKAELRRLPERGAAWRALEAMAEDKMGHARLASKDDNHDVKVLAAALVYARTGEERFRRKARAGVMDAVGSEEGGRTLGLGRGLVAYVIAADLIDLPRFDSSRDGVFRRWLAQVRFEKLRPKSRPTLAATHEVAPNNWGTMAGASRIAADVYLGDRSDLARAAAVFKGYLGDRAAYHGFVFGKDRSWQLDPSAPVGILPAGATKDGQPVGGALPDDMRRGCELRFPPCPTDYPWEALQGAVAQAELLSRQGYDAWNWGNQALRRAAEFLYGLARRYPDDHWAASGNDAWIPWLLNRRYGTRFGTVAPTQPGRGLGFTDWTHGPGARCAGRACTSPLGTHRSVTPVTDGPLGIDQRKGDGGRIPGVAVGKMAPGLAAAGLLAVAGALLVRALR